MNEQEQMDAADRVERFLADGAVVDVLRQLKEKNYDAFREAKTDDQMRAAHARGAVLDEFAKDLLTLVARGKTIKALQTRAERQTPKR